MFKICLVYFFDPANLPLMGHQQVLKTYKNQDSAVFQVSPSSGEILNYKID